MFSHLYTRMYYDLMEFVFSGVKWPPWRFWGAQKNTSLPLIAFMTVVKIIPPSETNGCRHIKPCVHVTHVCIHICEWFAYNMPKALFDVKERAGMPVR